MFCTSTRSEKEANGNSEVEVKPQACACAKQSTTAELIPVSVACEASRSISTSPWIGCYSIAGLPPAFNLPVPIYTPEWILSTVRVVSRPGTE